MKFSKKTKRFVGQKVCPVAHGQTDRQKCTMLYKGKKSKHAYKKRKSVNFEKQKNVPRIT